MAAIGKIKPSGYSNADLVRLMAKSFTEVWIPASSFTDVGDTEMAAIGSSTPVGMDYDPDTDEYAQVPWLVPKNLDVTKAIYVYVYWSAADSNAAHGAMWALEYLAVADTEVIGQAHTAVAATVDLNDDTPDALSIAPVITIPANACAATGEVLNLALYRDANHASDTVDTNAAVFGLKIVYSTLPTMSTITSKYGRAITKGGYRQEDIVRLVEKSVGQMWIPIGEFSNIGSAALSAHIGSGTAVGMLFSTSADENIEINLMMPENMDTEVAASIYAYWSSADTSGTATCCWSMDYMATAVGEDAGGGTTQVVGTADVDSSDADAMMIAPVLTLPASTLANTDELLSLSIFRDVSEDNISVDAVLYGIRIDYTTRPAISTSETVTDIKPTGVRMGDLVRLLDGQVGRIWLPQSKFSNVGASAGAAAIGGTEVVGMAFQSTGGDESIEIPILCPPNMDLNNPMNITVYWSSDDTTSTQTLQWDLDWIICAATEDIGAADADLAGTLDTNSGTADELQTAEIIPIPANSFASVDEILFLALRCDESVGDIDSDAEVYGVRIDYTTSPSISS